MKQSRATSFIKSLVSTAVGFIVAMVANAIVLPVFFRAPSLSENLIITVIYTVLSIARGYLLERAFEALGWRVKMSAFAVAVLAERQRQKDAEGYDEAHDDQHTEQELASGSVAYLLDRPAYWPWSSGFGVHNERRRKLVKGAAMAIALGDLHDRNRRKRRQSVVLPQPGDA